MKSAQIRDKFLKFFESRGHRLVKSSSLIPAADPTLLFTNAGMVQFKDCFLGSHDPGYRRATSCQKCVRAGGKHNDLENVGFTARHHTFFEMLGNFSFGDYFKKDAISFAWELLTKEYALPKDRLRITVFHEDEEALNLWKAQGIPSDSISRLGEKDNFWAMGETGPCGPCTEIHYDWGNEYGCKKTDCAPGCDCGRFLEIWNLVFMQFNRDATGKMTPLPKPSVDTGAGLERLSAVLQGVFSNYDTDLFTPLFSAITKVTHIKYGAQNETDVAMRVVADHLRSSSFLISDGVTPSNEGRGYVLRRILRRAIRYGKKMGQDRPFLYQLVPALTETLAFVYPELKQQEKNVQTLIQEEETRFHETLHRGIGLLEESLKEITTQKKTTLSGEIAFKLYDTFGFPLDLIQVMTHEHGVSVDEKSFEAFMEKQRQQSVWKGATESSAFAAIAKALEGQRLETSFLGYDCLESTGTVRALFSAKGEVRKALIEKERGYVVFDQTPFYAESGGQIGDQGSFLGHDVAGQILTTSKSGKTTLHQVQLENGKLLFGQNVQLAVDPDRRRLTAINHTATHMLHAALRRTLGDRVKQAGSLVDPSRLRFDFTYPRALSEEELFQIENLINDRIAPGDKIQVAEMPFEEAMKSGALAFFDEKYGDRVRVVRVGEEKEPFSVELCGGTHLKHSSEIGVFKVLTETSVASGVRRIEAITSTTALHFLMQRNRFLCQLEDTLKVKGEAVFKRVEELQLKLKAATSEIEKLQTASALGKTGTKSDGLWDKKIEVKGFQVVAEEVNGVNPKILRTLVDHVRDKLPQKTLVLLGSSQEGKVFLCLGLTKDLTSRWDASKILAPLAGLVGGSGGGKADFAQAGGSDASGMAKAFAALKQWVQDNA